MTTGKTIALTRQTFVSKITSLLFNMQSRLIMDFPSSSKRPLISQSPSAVILEPKKIKSVTASNVSPSICHEVMGLELDSILKSRDITLPTKVQLVKAMVFSSNRVWM